jgi:hypothetical protein
VTNYTLLTYAHLYHNGMSRIKIFLTEGYIQFFSLVVYLESRCPTIYKMSNMLYVVNVLQDQSPSGHWYFQWHQKFTIFFHFSTLGPNSFSAVLTCTYKSWICCSTGSVFPWHSLENCTIIFHIGNKEVSSEVSVARVFVSCGVRPFVFKHSSL